MRNAKRNSFILRRTPISQKLTILKVLIFFFNFYIFFNFPFLKFFIIAFTFDQIETEMAFKHIIKNELTKDPKETPEFKNYIAFIENQYKQLKKIWEEKIKQEEDSKEKNTKNKFIGLPSYDMKVYFIFFFYFGFFI